MGVRNFRTLLEKECPRCFRSPEDDRRAVMEEHGIPGVADGVDAYTRTRFAVDVAVFMYQFRYSADPDDDERFLRKFLDLHDRLCRKDFERPEGRNTCFFVFEGEGTLEDKQPELEKRAAQRVHTRARIARACEEIDKEIDAVPPEAPEREVVVADLAQRKRRHQQMDVVVKPVHYANLKRLFRKHRVPYFVAVGEAEFAATWLAREGHVDVVVTQDWDAVVAGAPRVLRNLGGHRKAMEEVRYAEALAQLKLTPAQLADVAILAGCDFCCTLPRVGALTGLKLIRRYGSIEKLLASYEGTKFREDAQLMQRFCYETARKRMIVDGNTPVQIRTSESLK